MRNPPVYTSCAVHLDDTLTTRIRTQRISKTLHVCYSHIKLQNVSWAVYVHKLARTSTNTTERPGFRSQVGHHPRLEMPSDGKEQVPGGIFNGISHNNGGRRSSDARPEEIETSELGLIGSRYRFEWGGGNFGTKAGRCNVIQLRCRSPSLNVVSCSLKTFSLHWVESRATWCGSYWMCGVIKWRKLSRCRTVCSTQFSCSKFEWTLGF